jgi:hypothetical protein
VFCSIGDYSVTKYHISRDGTRETTQTTLKEKLTSFEDKYTTQMNELSALEAQWEKIVGEIYKTGAACLGDEAMSSFLLEPETSSPPSPNLLPELGSLLDAPKKRVTFQEPEPHREYPNFLYGPSLCRDPPIAALPAVPVDEAKQLEDAVSRLGVKQIERFMELEAERAKWYNDKCLQIAKTLQSE